MTTRFSFFGWISIWLLQEIIICSAILCNATNYSILDLFHFLWFHFLHFFLFFCYQFLPSFCQSTFKMLPVFFNLAVIFLNCLKHFPFRCSLVRLFFLIFLWPFPCHLPFHVTSVLSSCSIFCSSNMSFFLFQFLLLWPTSSSLPPQTPLSQIPLASSVGLL